MFYIINCFILVYCLLHIIIENTTTPLWVASTTMALYVMVLIFFCLRSHRGKGIGLCVTSGLSAKEWPFLFPLLLLPLFNSLLGGGWPGLSAVVFMAAVATVEEILFRGFLLHALVRRCGRFATWISAAIFGVCHCLNFFGQSQFQWVLMQVFCAISLGLCYSELTLRYQSLLPGIFAHCLVNITGAGVVMPPGLGWEMWAMIGIIVSQTVCGVWLFRIKIRGRLHL